MRPLLPVLLPFIIGIASSERLGLSMGVALLLLAAALCPTLFFLARGRRFSPLMTAPAFFVLGALAMTPYLRPALPSNHVKNLIGTGLATAMEGAVCSAPEYSGGKERFCVTAERLFKDGSWREVSGKVLVTVKGGATGVMVGDGVRLIAEITEPASLANPGGYDYRRRLNLEGIYAQAYVRDRSAAIRISEGGMTPARYVEGLRGRINRFIEARGGPNQGVLKALIVGDDGSIARARMEAFRKTGTSHVLSISGLHAAVIALFVYNVALFLLRMSERVMLALNVKKAAALATLPFVFAYAALAGFPVSAERAVIMVAAFAVTYAMDRGRDHLNTLSLAALAILAYSPPSLWDVSFQLSFAAMGSLLYVVPRVNAFMGNGRERESVKGGMVERLVRGRVLPAVVATAAAAAGTSPLVALHFNGVSLAGLPANLAAIPLTGLITPLLFVSAALLPVSEGLASAALAPAGLMARALVFAVEAFSRIPYSSIRVATPTSLEVALYYLLLMAASYALNPGQAPDPARPPARRSRRKTAAYAAALLVAALIVVRGYAHYARAGSTALKATFISVGQGDSALVELPGGAAMLIDGGGMYGTDFDIGERAVAPVLWKKKIKRLDYMVLTHPQLDHMGGLRFIAENFDVGEFWWNGDGELGALGETLERRGVPIRVVDSSVAPIEVNGAAIEVIHPAKGLRLDVNDMSVVLRISYGLTGILFTGDIGWEAEALLAGRDLKATVLKAPHHGSRYSSGEGFLRGVGPSDVVVSTGRGNSSGLPHAEALERFRLIGADVFRTDVHGAVTVETDGRDMTVRPYLTKASR
jgi:competence protein ComEC